MTTAVLLGAASPPRPPLGWLRAIHETLGMSSAALGQRLGITASGVPKLERAGRTMALEAQLQGGRVPLAQPIPRQALVVPEAAEVPGSDGSGIGGPGART